MNPDKEGHTDNGTVPAVLFIYDKIVILSEDEAIDILEQAIVDHDDDVNFPLETHDKIVLLVKGRDYYPAPEEYDFDLRTEAALIRYHSPYPEVRSVTDPFDDPNSFVETFRAYLVGIIWVIIGSGVNQFFSVRQPPVSLSVSMLQILMLPSGKFYGNH